MFNLQMQPPIENSTIFCSLIFFIIISIQHYKFHAYGQLEFIVPFQHKYGYIRDERSQFIEDTVEPSVFLVILCIGII